MHFLYSSQPSSFNAWFVFNIRITLPLIHEWTLFIQIFSIKFYELQVYLSVFFWFSLFMAYLQNFLIIKWFRPYIKRGDNLKQKNSISFITYQQIRLQCHIQSRNHLQKLRSQYTALVFYSITELRKPFCKRFLGYWLS